ncbi:nuclear transport factor 2 family protein [Lichenicola sp.]|uniref:nuclear transport factor 2 family protein n=1 Tax=Lichenicola sp. TaxID=2804529 RepID=UPI003B009AA1
MKDPEPLSVEDRFAIFEQMNLHQQAIDAGWGLDQARAYVDLYWPDGKFTVIDLRHTTFEGADGLKRMYDYAHSVFPIEKWSHHMGPFRIDGRGDTATAHWRWLVRWSRETQGIVSTGTYDDNWEKRNGVWKCLERTSSVDGNWPLHTFQPYVDRQDELYRES